MTVGLTADGMFEGNVMCDRFTDRARKVMQLANQQAQRFNHEYIGTEHILLGLVQEGSGVAANVLKNLDIDLRKVRREIEKVVLTGPSCYVLGKRPQTPKARKVIEHAIEECRGLGHNYVGTEHVLLGLLREEEGVAAQVLMNLGLKLEDVRGEVLRMLGQAPAPSQPVIAHAKGVDAQGNPVKPIEFESGIACEKCGAPMVIRYGPRGPFLGCSKYPKCRSAKAVPEEMTEQLKLVEVEVLEDVGGNAEQEKRVRALEGQLWNVRLLLGLLCGALAGAVLGGPGAAIAGLVAGGVVGVCGGRTLGGLVGAGPGALLAHTYLGQDPAWSVVGLILGALVGACIGDVGRPAWPLRPREPRQRS